MPDIDYEKVKIQVVETCLHHLEASGVKFAGGAKARILGQVPKGITDKKEMIKEIDAAFTRERNCYF